MSYSDGAYQHQQPNLRSQGFPNLPRAPPLTTSTDFDILDWHPAYQSCQRYFVNHAQHEPGTQALCALINIRLPFQSPTNPVYSTAPVAVTHPITSGPSSYNQGQWPRPSPPPSSRIGSHAQSAPVFVSLVPYIRRLVITGFDKPGILHGFFGDAYRTGITPMQDCERRNYLFAAKHGGWRSCKRQYDMGPEETVPFLKPLQSVRTEEIEAAEESWSSWLSFEDWMMEPPGSSQAGEAHHRAAGGPSWAPGPSGFNSGPRDGLSD